MSKDVSHTAGPFALQRFFLACFSGFLGGHLTNYSVIFYAQDVWGSDALAGVGFSLCFGVPLFLGWHAGAWCDAYSPQKLAQRAHTAFLFGLAAFAIANENQGIIAKSLFLLGSGFVGIGWSILAPARMAILGRLAGNSQAKLAVLFNVLIMLGFGLAPPILAVCRYIGGWKAVYGLGFGLICLSMILLWGLNIPGLGATTHIRHRIKEGLGYAFGTPILRQALVLAILVFLSMGPVQVMLPRYATHVLGLVGISRGLFLGAMALSLLIGGGLALPLTKQFGYGRLTLVSGFMSGIFMALLGFSNSLGWAILFLMASGISAGCSISLIIALLQHESQPELRGRLLSVYTITSQVIPAFSGLLAGLILTISPVSQSLFYVGTLLTFGLSVALLRLKKLRNYS